MNNSLQKFLSDHNLGAEYIDLHDLVTVFRQDMQLGLEGKEGALRMIPAYIEAENDFITDEQVLAIDAGGTNFRASLATISARGKTDLAESVNHRMPGLEGEISSREFFETIAAYIRPLARKVNRIGFCFSYPTVILPGLDGRLLQFCKEVQARKVEGMLIGRNLLEALGMPEKKIVLLNDTVATLLAGKSAAAGRRYGSYIGFILGTGTNTCYIERNSRIVKDNSLDQGKSQIINIESGDFGRPPRNGLDISFDSTTASPGNYKFEKMFAGGYFGGLSLHVLKAAAHEGLFSEGSSAMISRLPDLSTGDANDFVAGTAGRGNILSGCLSGSEDAEKCRHIINSLTDRAAKLVAGNLAAVVLSTDSGRSACQPVLVTVEGTAFYKMHGLQENFLKYFSGYLRGESKRYVEFAEVPHSSLIGAALAALTE